jgi:hypothetical protein
LGLTKVGDKVEVLCNFSGSAEGVGAIVSNQASLYLNAGSSGAGTFSHNGDDLAFSDVAQNSTPASVAQTGVTLQEVQTATDAANPPFTGMAVQAFTFGVNKAGATAGIKNITWFNAQDLFGAGTEDEANFVTGVTQGTSTVYAVGRYALSGTRITSILDTSSTTENPLVQFALSPNGSSTPGLNNGDSSTPTGSQWVNVGNSGYFSGGNVGLALANGASAPPAIGYIGFADAQGKFGSTGAVPINYMGQTPYIGTYGSGNWNISGVENGSYCFWSYERLYELGTDVGTAYDNYGQDLVVGVQYEITHAATPTAAVEANMNVYRNTDGGDVIP